MIRIESPDLNRLAIGAKAFPKAVRVATRKELTVIGRSGQRDSKKKIRSMPSQGKGDTLNRLARFDAGIFTAQSLRSDIASAVKVSATANTVRGVGVRIYVAETGALKDHRRFRAAQLLDKGVPFRHRVYGKDVWVEQPGFEYFRAVIAAKAPEMQIAARRVIEEATRAVVPNVRP